MHARLLLPAILLGSTSFLGVACGTGGEGLFQSGGGGAGPTTNSGGAPATGGSNAIGGGGAGASGGTSMTGGAPGTGGSGGVAGSPSSGGGGSGGAPAGCGDGKLEAGEVCDGANLDGQDCRDFGYQDRAGLGCAPDCTKFDTSGCHAVCGNGKVEPGEDCDGGDDCSPTCHTMIVAGSTCATAIPVALAPGSTTASGATTKGGTHSGTGCASAGHDLVYAVTPAADGFLTASLARPGTSYDSALWAAKACDDAAALATLGCNDSHGDAGDAPLLGGEVISFRVQHGTTYYVFVDGPTAADAGTFAVTFDLSTGADCNDPVPIPLAAGSPMTLSGSTSGNAMNETGTCGGGPGSEVVYAITTPTVSGLTIATDGVDYNTVLYARSTCSGVGQQLACANAGGSGADETITIPAVPVAGTLALYVDGSQIGGGPANGNYQLVLTPP